MKKQKRDEYDFIDRKALFLFCQKRTRIGGDVHVLKIECSNEIVDEYDFKHLINKVVKIVDEYDFIDLID